MFGLQPSPDLLGVADFRQSNALERGTVLCPEQNPAKTRIIRRPESRSLHGQERCHAFWDNLLSFESSMQARDVRV